MGEITQIVLYVIGKSLEDHVSPQAYRTFLLLGICIVISGVVIPLCLLTIIDITKRWEFLRPFLLILPISDLGRQFRIWTLYIKRFGLPTFNTMRKMWQIDARRSYNSDKYGVRGHVLLYVIAFTIVACGWIVLWWLTALSAFLYLAIFQMVLAIKRVIRLARPPAVLLLAVSSSQATGLQMFIYRIIAPLEVYVLLIHSEDLPNVASYLINFLNYRTSSNQIWQDSVVTLLQVSPLIVVDARVRTAALDFEIEKIRELGVEYKTYYLVENLINNIFPRDKCFTLRTLGIELRKIRIGRATS